MRQKRGHITVTILILVMSILFLPALSYGNQIGEKQNELDDIQDQIDNRSEALEEQKQALEQSLEELAALEQKVAETRRELDRLSGAISDKEEEIEIKATEIKATEAELAERQEGLDNRLRAMYQYGSAGYLEVLFAATSFSDFLTRFQALQVIADNDSRLIAEVEEAKRILEAEKQTLDQQREELVSLRRAQLAKKAELDRQTARQTVLVAQIEQEVEAQEEAIKELESEAESLEELIKKLQEEQAMAGRGGNANFIWPMFEYQRAWITSPYGYRTHPITGKPQSFHGGVDIGIPHSRWPASYSYNGSPVYLRAAEDGVVIYAGISGSLTYGYGRLVIIDHGGGYATVYAHTHQILVETGQWVSQGQNIAIVGSTGSSTGPHVHFEVRVNGERENPLNYLP